MERIDNTQPNDSDQAFGAELSSQNNEMGQNPTIPPNEYINPLAAALGQFDKNDSTRPIPSDEEVYNFLTSNPELLKLDSEAVQEIMRFAGMRVETINKKNQL